MMKKVKRDEIEQKIENDEKVNLIDVREADELEEKKMKEAKHIPIGDIADRLDEFNQDETYHIICERGNRSGDVVEYLENKGYDAVNVVDGMTNWEE